MAMNESERESSAASPSESGSAAGGGGGSRAGEAAARLGDESKRVTATATDGAREVVSQAADEVSSVVGQARDQIDTLIGDARHELQQQADARSAQAAEGLRGLSHQFAALAGGRPGDADQLVHYMQSAQHKLSDVATRIEQRGPQGMLDEVTSFARRRPGVFLLCAAGAGFAIGRLVRSGALTQTSNGHGEEQLPQTMASAQPLSGAVPGAIDVSTGASERATRPSAADAETAW